MSRAGTHAGTGAGTAPVYPVYNVADDLPAPQRAVVEFAAGLAGVAPPPLAPYDRGALPPALQRFYEACRRIRNDRIKDDLGVALQFPTYREGLRAIAIGRGPALAAGPRGQRHTSPVVRISRARSCGSERR